MVSHYILGNHLLFEQILLFYPYQSNVILFYETIKDDHKIILFLLSQRWYTGLNIRVIVVILNWWYKSIKINISRVIPLIDIKINLSTKNEKKKKKDLFYNRRNKFENTIVAGNLINYKWIS